MKKLPERISGSFFSVSKKYFSHASKAIVNFEKFTIVLI